MNNQFGLKTGLNTGLGTGWNMGTGFHYVGNDASETLNNINSWQTNTKKQYYEAKNQEIANQAQNMFECSVRTDDGQVRKMNMSGANLNNMALLIKQASNQQGFHSYDELDPGAALCRFLQKNPKYFILTQDTLDGKISLDDWAYETKIIDPLSNINPESLGQSAEPDGPNNFIDWVKEVGKSFLSFFETGGDAVRNIVDYGIGLVEGDQTPGALENYAQMNYGKDFYSLSSVEKDTARKAVSAEEGMDMYKPSIQRALLRGGEAALDAAITINMPYTKGELSVRENTPGLSDILEVGGLILQGGGWIVNHTTLLYLFRQTLQTQEEKQEFDAFVGTLGFIKAFQKRSSRTDTGGGIKETIVKELNPEIMIEEFKNRISDLPNIPKNVKEWISRVKNKTAPQKISNEEAKAWADRYSKKITGADLKNIDTVKRALSNLEGEFKTTEDIYNANEIFKNEIIDLEDEILKYDTRKIGLDDIDMMNWKELEMDGETELVTAPNPLLDTIDGLIECYEEFPEEAAKYRLIRKNLLNGKKVTKSEIATIKREISKAVNEYKPLGGDAYKDKMASRMRRNSRALNEIIRAGFNDIIPGIEDPLKALDSAYHDSYILSEYLYKKMDKMSDQEQRVPPRGEIRGSWRSVFANLFPRFKGSIGGTAEQIGKKWARIGNMNELEMEEYMGEMVEDFRTLMKMAGEEGEDVSKIRRTIDDLKNIVDETPREDMVGDTVEPEIIEPEEPVKRNVYDSNLYLNDKVIVEKPESFMLPDDAQYNGQDPIDYTNTTRVTPEGNAGRKGQTVEQNKGEYREGVTNPREEAANKIKEEYAKKYKDSISKIFEAMGIDKETANNAASAIQESLFGEIEGGERTDFLGRKVGRRKKSK